MILTLQKFHCIHEWFIIITESCSWSSLKHLSVVFRFKIKSESQTVMDSDICSGIQRFKKTNKLVSPVTAFLTSHREKHQQKKKKSMEQVEGCNGAVRCGDEWWKQVWTDVWYTQTCIYELFESRALSEAFSHCVL